MKKERKLYYCIDNTDPSLYGHCTTVPHWLLVPSLSLSAGFIYLTRLPLSVPDDTMSRDHHHHLSTTTKGYIQ